MLIEDVEGWPVLMAQGKLHYLAASGTKALVQRIVDLLITEANLPTLNLPAGVRCRVRDGLHGGAGVPAQCPGQSSLRGQSLAGL